MRWCRLGERMTHHDAAARAVVSGARSPGDASRRRGSQHRRLGHGTRHIRPGIPRGACQRCCKILAHGSRKRCAFSCALRRCYRTAANCRPSCNRRQSTAPTGRQGSRREYARGPRFIEGGLIAKLQHGEQIIDVRSPISGRIHNLSAQTGQTVAAGAALAIVDPSTDQVWEALRAPLLRWAA